MVWSLHSMSLALYVARRLVVLVPTLFVVSVLIFSLQQLLPGDAALALAGEERDEAAVAAIRAKYHLDRPVVTQYAIWMGKVLRGDLGESLRNRLPVTELLASKLPVTLELAAASMLIALAIGIPAGVLSASRRGTVTDLTANLVALPGLSVPHFWLGIMLILLFAVRLGWLPASGYVPPWEDLGRNLTTILLPSIVLGTGVAGVMMRHTRGAMLQTLSADYVRTARAKSVPERLVILKHALRNALIPVITLGAIEFGRLLSGAVLTEQIFAIPGFGKLLVDGVFNRDYAVVQGVVLVSATLYVLLNLLAGVIPVALALAASIPLGLLSGYAGGWIDGLIMRVTDAMLAIPFLIVAIALAAFLGPSLTNAMIAIGIAALPTFLRLSRGTVLGITTEEYIEAARAVGCSHVRIAVGHILPNMVPPLLVQSSITVAAAIIAEASLSFLGLGQQPPAPSWGSMLNAAQRYLSQAPWIALYPGLVIFSLVMALNVLGDGLRDALDPRQQ